MVVEQTSGILCGTCSPSPTIFKRLFGKVKGNGNQIMVSHLAGDAISSNFILLATVGESCIKAFSYLRKTLGTVLKNKDH